MSIIEQLAELEAAPVLRPAHRLGALSLYVFAELESRLRALRARGVDVIRLDIGSPDGPPAPHIVEALANSAAAPNVHGYPGHPKLALRQAIAARYRDRFGVTLDPESEVLPLLGSKEGVANMALAWLDPGDVALVPDPGYPAYSGGVQMAGASVVTFPLLPERGYLPDLSAIPAEVARRARLMWLNYPNNPTGAVAPLEFFEAAVAFCRRHGILLCHDAPYADVCYDGYQGLSLLAVPGATDVAVEFNSLSKSHNMAGWRVGMALGNRVALAALAQVKSNVDSGIFIPVQEAACAALTGDQSWLIARNREYQRRRDLLLDLFREDWGLEVGRPLAGLYLWPRVPAGSTSDRFVERILSETGVSFASGTAFGPGGEGFIRVSVGQTTARLNEAVERLRKFKC